MAAHFPAVQFPATVRRALAQPRTRWVSPYPRFRRVGWRLYGCAQEFRKPEGQRTPGKLQCRQANRVVTAVWRQWRRASAVLAWEPVPVFAIALVSPLNSFGRSSRRCRTSRRRPVAQAMENAEHGRNEQQRGHRGEEQSTNYGAAQRSVLLATVSESERHRQHADDHCQSRHDYGAKTSEPSLKSRGHGVFAFAHLFRGELHHQDAVGGGYTHAHDRARERRDAQRCTRNEQEPGDSREGCGKRSDNDERVQPRLKVHDDKEVDKDNSEDQPCQETDVRRTHRLHLAAHNNLRAAGQLWPHLIDDMCNVAGNAAEIASLHRAKDVDDGHDVVVRDHRRAGSALDGREAGEKGRCDVGRGSGNGHVREILKRVDAILRGLTRDVVTVSILRVEPVSWSGLEAATQRD